MPIKIQDSLPAAKVFDEENIFIMTHERAVSQDIRPLKIILVNLMPNKIETETQILRLLSNSPLQVDIDLLQMASHTSRNTAVSHIETFYKSFDQVKHERYDGMIVTGAPVEMFEYANVDYWEELCKVFEWSKSHVYSSLFICWGAQAALYHFYDIPKYQLDEKISGIFRHRLLNPNHPLLRGFDDRFLMPHSRNTEVRLEDIEKNPNLIVLSTSRIAGVALIADKTGRRFFVTGHPEYDRKTLANEYFRDRHKGLEPNIPENYFPGNDPYSLPALTWRSHANLLYTNWLNYYVYQQTPYNIRDIK